MPPFDWPDDPIEIIGQFESRHSNPEAGALLLFAMWTIDSLYYLQDLDDTHDLSQTTVAGHRPDVVEVAHSRWATGACITALDLCVAALGRALCTYTGKPELAVSDLYRKRKGIPDLRALLPSEALQWVEAVNADPRYKQIKAIRNALTHARVLRHFTVPRRRLEIQIKNDRFDVPTVIRYARSVGTTHVSKLLTVLPLI